MDCFKLQKRSCHSVALIISICWYLCVRQITSAAIPSKRTSLLVRRLVDSIKNEKEFGPLKLYTDAKGNGLVNEGQGLGQGLDKIDTLDNFKTEMITKNRPQDSFRDWLDFPTRQHGVGIQGDDLYDERHSIDPLMAWHEHQKGPLPPNKIQKHQRYPLSKDVSPEPHIPANSYLRTTPMTPGEFINRYLPEDFFYRSRFSYILQTRFIDSTSYWAEEFFTRYEKFAMEEVDKLKTSSKDMSRGEFTDSYLPPIHGVRKEFWEYFDQMEQLSNGGEIIPTNILMSAYLQWAKEYHIWRPSDTDRFFHFKFGDPRLQSSFINYLYKKASRLGLTKEQAYFRGKFQWEYSSFLKEREKANFAKKIYYKFQGWKYDSHLAWIAFKHKVLKVDKMKSFFLGTTIGELGSLISKIFQM